MKEFTSEVNRLPDGDTETVIYVKKCEKYEWENPDKTICSIHNSKEPKICDIIDAVEDYYN